MKFKIALLTTIVLYGCTATTYAAPAAPASSVTEAFTSTETVVRTEPAVQPYVREKRFWRAAGEAIIIGWSPWVFSHYILDADYADISIDSMKRNFEDGFWYDHDAFKTNQKGHPQQGSLYFNAARVNGFSFWESAPFVLVGDFGWECCMEAERPSYNDMVNTFLGGMSRGEVTYRLSKSLLDNRATGANRFWREFGAGVLNPVGFFDRLVFGDMWKKFENPPDRHPTKLYVQLDSGYARSREDSTHPNQGFVNLTMRQNDPHTTRIKAPFDYYDLDMTMTLGEGPLLPWVAFRGLLAGWEMGSDERSHHLLAPGLTYSYFNNMANTSFGGQGLDMMLFSRWDLANEFEVRTEAGAMGTIFAGIQTDYADESLALAGRNYDFASGGGPKLDFKLRRRDVDWLHVYGYMGWFLTNDGISTQNRIFLFASEARYPLMKDLYAGVGWSYQERHTLYDQFPATTLDNSTLKVFLTYGFRLI